MSGVLGVVALVVGAGVLTAWFLRQVALPSEASGVESELDRPPSGEPPAPRGGAHPAAAVRCRVNLPELVNSALDSIRERFAGVQVVVRVAADLEPVMVEREVLRDELLARLTRVASDAGPTDTVEVAMANDLDGPGEERGPGRGGHFVVLQVDLLAGGAEATRTTPYRKLLAAAPRTTGVHRVVAPAVLDATAELPADTRGSWERVLLVDDEAAVRSTSRRILESAGYLVEEADSAEDARRVIAQGQPPAVLVTDVVMPGDDGTVLATELVARFPNLRVLLISGLGTSERGGGAGRDPFPLLRKPFEAIELASGVRRLLDSPPGALSGGDWRNQGDGA